MEMMSVLGQEKLSQLWGYCQHLKGLVNSGIDQLDRVSRKSDPKAQLRVGCRWNIPYLEAVEIAGNTQRQVDATVMPREAIS